jgi:hypothetical protein
VADSNCCVTLCATVCATLIGMAAAPQDPDIEIFDGAFRFELEEARRLLANATAVVDALGRGRRDAEDLGLIDVDLRTLVDELTNALRDTDNP